MPYEPRGRVQGLLDLMRAAPERTWNTAPSDLVRKIVGRMAWSPLR